MASTMDDRSDEVHLTSTCEDHRRAGLTRRAMLGALSVAGAGLLGAPTVAAATPAAHSHVPRPDRIRPLNLVAFSALNGVPIYYGAQTSPRTWYCTAGFLTSLQAWMTTLNSWSAGAGYGAVSSVGSAGFYVDKAGQHGAGTAMDVSIVRWSGGAVSDMLNGDHASANPTLRRRYFAVECTLRQHFRFVLDGNYNAAHANHFHADLGGLPNRRLLQGSNSDTFFLQAVANDFMGAGIAVDGIWGPQTAAQVTTLKSRLGVTGDLQSNQAAVTSLLQGISARGFADQAI